MRQKIYNAARFYMRLKTEIWVQALVLRAAHGGAMATVFNRGDKDAGDCLIRANTLDASSSKTYAQTKQETISKRLLYQV